MLARSFLRRGRVKILTATLGLLGTVAIFLHTSRSTLHHQISQWPQVPHLASAKTVQLPLPLEYDTVLPQSDYCTDRFSAKYLEDLRDNAVEYCQPGSRSTFTCFHSHRGADGQADSMCIGHSAIFDSSGKFTLDCSVRQLSANEVVEGLVPFGSMRGYWYNTGPPKVIAKAVRLFTTETGRQEAVELEQQQGQQTADGAGPGGGPRFYLLLQREGDANTWHSLMEIWSSWLTIDVLRMAGHTYRDDDDSDSIPFFRAPDDVADTQVVVLDDHPDGPYFDLWTLFAGRRPVRLRELIASKPAAADTINGGRSNIIIPLAGGSNPLWQNDWEIRDCTTGMTLSTFVRRILGFYSIADKSKQGPDEDIVVTFVDRLASRRLINQTGLFAMLKERTPHISIQLVDFATLPFVDQLRVARETDVLVGVHGAGLTHMMFMPAGAGAVVEIQPAELNHAGFRNLAAMRQLNYFHVHAASVLQDDKGGESDSVQPDGRNNDTIRRRNQWQANDVMIEPERFLEVVSIAIKSLYSQGPRNYDII